MEKKLLAAAVCAALIPMSAQAEVKVSGRMDVSYNFIDNDGAADGDFQDISANNSFLRFKGAEDLGGGLKAIWQAALVVRVDATAAPFDRNTYVGLKGDWGQVRIGRHETPFKMVGRKVDLFGNRQMGENRILVTPNANGAAGPSPQFSWDKRPSEGLHYISPVMSGFSVGVAYMPEGISNGADDGDAWSLAGVYANGPLYVGLGYETMNENYPGMIGTEDSSGWRLSGSYKFGGGFRVTGLYQDVSDDRGVSDADFDVWGIGGAYSFGNNTVKAQYYDREGDGALNNADANMFAIGFDHKFSKRTMVWASYAAVDNDSGAQFTVNSQGFDSGGNASWVGRANGQDSDGFAIGMTHKF